MPNKDEYVKVFEDYINKLIVGQAEMMLEINSLQRALEQHQKDSIKYYLTYTYDDETGVYAYTIGEEKKIGF